ncbi:MAG: redoxin domain-containing protein [Gammaproteobacteria bacterium]|nr:redoxin domain-containing protein [Gammaproteobacteria bacterium]
MFAKNDQSRRGFLRRAGYLTAGFVGVSQSSGALAAEGDKYGIRGQVAPEIKLDYWVNGEGEEASFSMQKAKGKWVFLKFFQNWCPGCHSSGFPTLKAFCDEFYGHPEVEIAGVQTVFEGYGTNTQDAVRDLQLRYDIPAVMGHDPGDHEAGIPALTMVNYRTGGTPWLVLVNPDGIVVFNNFHVDRNKLIEYVQSQIA